MTYNIINIIYFSNYIARTYLLSAKCILVCARIDYGNAVYFVLSSTDACKLQVILIDASPPQRGHRDVLEDVL